MELISSNVINEETPFNVNWGILSRMMIEIFEPSCKIVSSCFILQKDDRW